MKTPVSKENVAHPCSQQLSGHTIFELCDRTKKLTKPFSPVHMGPRSNLLSQKNSLKSRDTVPFNSWSWWEACQNYCFQDLRFNNLSHVFKGSVPMLRDVQDTVFSSCTSCLVSLFITKLKLLRLCKDIHNINQNIALFRTVSFLIWITIF